MSTNYDLSIVIPLYNEEKNIVSLIHDWEAVFNHNNIGHQYFIINDGSTDKSLELLSVVAGTIPNINIFTYENEGHGESLLKAYKMALNTTWVFQIDSDHQLENSAFNILWNNKDNYDFLLAQRENKNATAARNFISFISRMIVYLIYGNKVHDVNSPYRLMRSEKLKEAINLIGVKKFAPNILLTGFFIFKKTRIFTTVVHQRNDALSKKSKMNMYFLKGAIRSIFQVIFFRFKL